MLPEEPIWAEQLTEGRKYIEKYKNTITLFSAGIFSNIILKCANVKIKPSPMLHGMCNHRFCKRRSKGCRASMDEILKYLKAEIVSPCHKPPSSPPKLSKHECPLVAPQHFSFSLSFKHESLTHSGDGEASFLRQVSVDGSTCERRGGEEKSRPTKMRTDSLIGDNG